MMPPQGYPSEQDPKEESAPGELYGQRDHEYPSHYRGYYEGELGPNKAIHRLKPPRSFQASSSNQHNSKSSHYSSIKNSGPESSKNDEEDSGEDDEHDSKEDDLHNSTNTLSQSRNQLKRFKQLIEAKASNVLHVKGLDSPEITAELMNSLFSNFGNIIKLLFLHHKKASFLVYKHKDLATIAKEMMSNLRFFDSHLKVP